MKKSINLSMGLLVSAGLLFTANSSAADFEWSGVYRVEGYHIKNSELDGRGRELDYGLHHLSLRPKIVAGDGITIFGQFEILTNNQYPNSQLGQIFGDGIGTAGVPANGADDSNTMAGHQESDLFLISQLYLSWVQEYGALIVGRAPLHFGLGMTYNSGQGLFDHWFDTRDLIGYKVVMGNMFVLPMYGKVNEGDLNINEDVNDMMIQVGYDNPETDLEMGAFYRVRRSADSGSDAISIVNGAGNTPGETNYNELSIFALRDTERFRIGVEGSFLSGKVGVKQNNLDQVTMNGFGVAVELEYRPEKSTWVYGAKLGSASGDNPDSDTRYEGFVFDRNYDVAMLLFNRPLGRQDVLRTGFFGGGPDANGDIDKPDVESVSNVHYLAPWARYRWTDRLKLTGVLATGWLDNDPVAGATEVGKQLGYELDLSLSYSPRKGIEWVNEVGMLFPGSAFEFNGDKPGFAYGVISKAAISF